MNGGAALVGVLVSLLGVAAAARGDDRVVHVKVTCVNAAGQPVAGVPIVGRARGGSGGWFGVSNQAGVAERDVAVSPTERVMWLSNMPMETESGEYEKTTEQAYSDALGRLYLRLAWCEPIAETQAVCDWTIVVPEVRTVTLHGVAGSQPKGAVVLSDFFTIPEGSEPEGTITVSGMPKGMSQRIGLWSDGFVTEVELPAGENDADLGTVQLQTVPKNGAVVIHLDNVEGMDERSESPGDLITLVSTTEPVVMQLIVRGGKTVKDMRDDSPAQVPAGQYWVCPESWTMHGATGALLRMVRSGVDLRASGIPKVTVPAGGVAEVRVDGAAAQASILRAGIAAGVGPCGE